MREKTEMLPRLLRKAGEDGLVLGNVEIRGKYGVEAPLLIPVVNQDHGRNAQGPLAIAAGAHLTLEILYESVRKVILGTRPARGLGPVRSAMRARILDHILKRVAIQRGPACVANTNCLK